MESVNELQNISFVSFQGGKKSHIYQRRQQQLTVYGTAPLLCQRCELKRLSKVCEHVVEGGVGRADVQCVSVSAVSKENQTFTHIHPLL